MTSKIYEFLLQQTWVFDRLWYINSFSTEIVLHTHEQQTLLRSHLFLIDCMYDQFAFSVTTCEHATIALSLLRDRRGRYDIVLTDVHMPDMDGFKLLEIVGLEMDLPVVSEYLTQTQLPLISFMFISIYRLLQVIEFQGMLRLHISFKWIKKKKNQR